jgi:hypothetical protein
MSRFTRRGDDRGASLIFALIIVVVIAMLVTVVLTFTDTSLRATLVMRSQSQDAASADGAAQIAINDARKGVYSGGLGGCFGSGLGASNTLNLNNFYQPPNGTPYSAEVDCTADPALAGSSLVAVSPLTRPPAALLTLSRAAGEDGAHITAAAGQVLGVHGSVFSNSTIAIPTGQLSSDNTLAARGACTGTVVGVPAASCGLGLGVDPRFDDPNYPVPIVTSTIQVVPTCTGTLNEVVTFTPGVYTDVSSLNNLTRCNFPILWFQPGTYYFNLPGTTPWTIVNSYLVGGTPTKPLGGAAPSIPGACQSPVPPSPPGAWTPPATNAGVEFVFGGASQIQLQGSQMELCGSYSASAPPIAIYGIKNANITVNSSPTIIVPDIGGCVQNTPYPGGLGTCAMISQDNAANSRFYVQGTVYAPQSAIDIALNNATGPTFADGAIVRTLDLSPTATAGLTQPVLSLPDLVVVGLRTVLYLTVYICADQPTCTAATGALRLRVKFGLLDSTGVPVGGQRQVTIYNWSVVRG